MELRDAAVRERLGIPRAVAARLAGVARHTLTLYEASPSCVSEAKAEACRRVYDLLRTVLRQMPGERRRGA